ncbi:MAG: hypothetical protein WC349_03785 [Patescibacteria group bacterium]|jgi:hypothetical protein
MTKKYLFLLILPLALVTVVSGCGKRPDIIVNQPENNNINNSQNEVSTTTNNGIATTTEINLDLENWKDYKDTDYNFQIKYPQNLFFNNLGLEEIRKDVKKYIIIQGPQYGESYLSENNIRIYITVYESNKSLNDWYEDFQPKSDEEQREESINFGGEHRNISEDDLIVKTEYFDSYIKHLWKAQVLIWEGPPSTIITYYYKNKNNIFQIEFLTRTEDAKIMMPFVTKMLNTFKY